MSLLWMALLLSIHVAAWLISFRQLEGRFERPTTRVVDISFFQFTWARMESLEEEIDSSSFQKIWQVLLALKSQDDQLSKALDSIRINRGKSVPSAVDRRYLG